MYKGYSKLERFLVLLRVSWDIIFRERLSILGACIDVAVKIVTYHW
jgi:hypothetical protein